MVCKDFKSQLLFYFIIDYEAPMPIERQAEIAVLAGATIVQYRNKNFGPAGFEELIAVRNLCRTNQVLFIVNDDIMLAKAAGADGVHLGRSDDAHGQARRILGEYAIIGASVSTVEELEKTDLASCDYIGTGPVFHTSTKKDASSVIGPEGLGKVVLNSPVPVVAIGGISADTAGLCFSAGASGIAVISAITRAADPVKSAMDIGAACGLAPFDLKTPWRDEFELIDSIIGSSGSAAGHYFVRVPPGDDAALFFDMNKPVFTTDTQREGVHFRRQWQTMYEIGQRAVEITLSDLAASYAVPAGLFVNLCIPAETAQEDVIELYGGIDSALLNYSTALAGGNVSSGDVLALDLFAAGEGSDIFPRRDAAVSGDGLYVTGRLGLARAGLKCLAGQDFSFPRLIEKFKFPRARFDAAAVLLLYGVQCAMDISDGLFGDASHIASSSGVSVEFEPSLFEIDDQLAAYCEKYELDPAGQILAGGEDYELLFSCSREIFEKISPVLPGAHRVGRIIGKTDRLCVNVPEGTASYRHGRSSRD